MNGESRRKNSMCDIDTRIDLLVRWTGIGYRRFRFDAGCPLPFSYVQFMTELMARRPYPRQPNFAPPRLTPLRKPISQSTIGIFTSAGVQLRDGVPLKETNDLSYRLIDRSTPYSELTVAHKTPVGS